MFQISGVKLDNNKKLIYSLAKIYGIGYKNAFQISKNIGLTPYLKIKNLSEKQKKIIFFYIKKNIFTENNLKKKIINNIEEMIENKS